MARWSASGGDTVPAVMFASGVVMFQSMRVAVLCSWLYLVGVVMVVCSPCDVRVLVVARAGVRLSRFMFMSPWMSMVVRGVRARILSIMSERSCMNVLSVFFGRLYMLITVLLASVLAGVLCICMIMEWTCRIVMSVIVVMCRLDLWYTDTSCL